MRVGVLAVCGVAMATFATGVATSQTQADLVTGAWACSADTADGVVAGQMNYKPDGTMDAAVTVTMDMGGATMTVDVTAKSTWKLLGGGLIEEQILSANATGGRVGDEALPESMLAMVSEGVPKDLGTSTIEVSSGQMVLVDGEGTRTVCTR